MERSLQVKVARAEVDLRDRLGARLDIYRRDRRVRRGKSSPISYSQVFSVLSAVNALVLIFAILRAAGSLTGRKSCQPRNTTPEPIREFHQSGAESA
jgi:hypothetical protein